jgi:hypothetical protein
MGANFKRGNRIDRAELSSPFGERLFLFVLIRANWRYSRATELSAGGEASLYNG